ncbi:carbon-nitrogen hydrolase family protein [Oricola sp.]|uniref:carbon-nitrogen hydrolase family protein n=1 Tax=Oricola sp. TaxID=1979950 RepID=UPI0035136FBD
MARPLTCAAVQMRSTTDIAVNRDDLERLVREAAGRGATYVQTPEMTGLIQKNRPALLEEISPEADDPIAATASSLAKDLGIWLHIGSTPIALGDGKVANRALLFAPDGGKRVSYDKIHMFDVDLDNGESWRESAVYQPGDSAVTVQMDDALVGLAICYDVRFPDIFRQQALAGADILTSPAAFTRQTGEAHWHVLLRARAIENGAFMIAAAQGGTHEDTRETYGHSLIIDPWGRIIAEKDDDEPGVITAEIDLDAVLEARQKIPNLKNIRQFNLVGPQ